METNIAWRMRDNTLRVVGASRSRLRFTGGEKSPLLICPGPRPIVARAARSFYILSQCHLFPPVPAPTHRERDNFEYYGEWKTRFTVSSCLARGSGVGKKKKKTWIIKAAVKGTGNVGENDPNIIRECVRRDPSDVALPTLVAARRNIYMAFPFKC